MSTFIFFLLSSVALISAVMVVVQKNPVYSALYLVLTLLSIAGFYATLDALFLAAVQVIVYAGAIMVLFLFVVMLLDMRHGGFGEGRRPPQGLVALFLAAGLLVAMLLVLFQAEPMAIEPAPVGPSGGNTEQMGRLIFEQWIYPLEICSALLLAAAIGAVVLAKQDRSA